MFTNTPKYKLILASKSPRRQQLLKDLGWEFQTEIKDVEEIYPPSLKREEVPLFLSKLKAEAFCKDLSENELVITADTIVCLNNEIIGKPKDYSDAVSILKKLSGQKHEVITGITLVSKSKEKSFHVITEVFFKPLTEDEISYYLENYKPFDKAGSYGIQEWIGYIGIEKINGSYFNVMGLPVKELYEEILAF